MEPDLQTPIKSTIPYTFAQTTKISEVPQLCDERARVLRYPNTPTDMLGHVRWQFWHSFSCGEHEKSAASLTLGLSFFYFLLTVFSSSLCALLITTEALAQTALQARWACSAQGVSEAVCCPACPCVTAIPTYMLIYSALCDSYIIQFTNPLIYLK